MTASLRHFMLREIWEEGEAARRTAESVSKSLKELTPSLSPTKFVYFTGSGTSYHASMVGQYVMGRLAGVFSSPVPASEFRHWASPVSSETLVVAVSQSGESVNTVDAARYAKERGAKVVAVTSTPESSLAALSDHVLQTAAGEEKAVTATKTYISQLVAIYLLSSSLGEAKGREEAGKVKGFFSRLPSQIDETVKSSSSQVERLAEEFKSTEFFFILGTGPNYATALEGALKLKEAANVFAEGFATREFLHGPMQLVDEKTPVMIIVPSREHMGACVSLAHRFEKLKAPVVLLTDQEGWERCILVPPVVEQILSPIFFVIPLQLFSYYLSVAKGLNPDNPKKLAKVVR
nr:SIS domain-containing protein [Candidatus Bathyarchaeota archaeon]